MIKVTCPTCELRPLVPSDANSLALHANDREIWLNLRDRFPHPYALHHAEEYIALVDGQSPVISFGIIVDGEAAGGISLMPGHDIERYSAEIGYWLGRAYWGRGVMTDAMRAAIYDGLKSGATHIAFGDLFLEDVRAYRARQLEGSGLEPLFPIWQEPTGPLARRIIDAGVEAVVTCVDPKKLARTFAGRRFDHTFLDELPQDVDPCGENGEFHTCVLAGPMFREPLRAAVGEIVERDGFVFADLVPDAAVRTGSPIASNAPLPQ